MFSLYSETEESLTRVVVRTVERRGKSLIPVSRIAIDESRSESDERSEATEAESDAADDAVAIGYLNAVSGRGWSRRYKSAR